MSYCIRLNGQQEDNYVLAFCARIGILCTRYLYSVIDSTPIPWDSGSWIELNLSPWDSGSRIETPSQNVGYYCIGQLISWVKVGRSHDTVMGLSAF